MPTWNLRTFCQSVQAASELPEGLSAYEREGATRLAMMGDQSQRKRGNVKLKRLLLADYATVVTVETFIGAYGVASLSTA